MAVGVGVTTDLMNTLCVMGIEVLRKKTPLLIRTNREYESDLVSAVPNATVNIEIPAPIEVKTVTPSHVPPGAEVFTPTKVPITLNMWKRAPFAFDDKQLRQVNRNIVPSQLEEAVIALAEYIEADVWAKSLYRFYGYAGAAGSTPFATGVDEYLAAEKIANDQKMNSARFMIMDTAANANWRGLRRTYDKNFEDVGVEVLWSQLVPTHTAGTGASWTVNGAHATVGVKTLAITGGSGTILQGDIITIAGHDQTYSVQADYVATSITIEPGLQVALSGSEAITLKASHVVNLLADRKAIAFAMAPMAGGLRVPGGSMEQAINDPDTGLGFRLIVSNQYYQTEWAIDALWGSAVPQCERGVRIAG